MGLKALMFLKARVGANDERLGDDLSCCESSSITADGRSRTGEEKTNKHVLCPSHSEPSINRDGRTKAQSTVSSQEADENQIPSKPGGNI